MAPTPATLDILSAVPWFVGDGVVVVVVSDSVEGRPASTLLPGTLLFFLWTSGRSHDACAEPTFLLRIATGPTNSVEDGGVTDCGVRGKDDGRRDSTPVAVGAVAPAVVEVIVGRLLMTFGCRLPAPL